MTKTIKAANIGGNTRISSLMSATAPAVVPVSAKRPRRVQVASTTHSAPAWVCLSFIETRTSRQGTHCVDWFAVPEQDYCAGWATGLQVVGELMSFAQRHPAPALHAVQSVMCAAALVAAKPITKHLDKHGAAAAVLHCFTRFMLSADMVSAGGGRCLAIPQWLTLEAAQHTQFMAEAEREGARRKAEFVARMQAARRGKRQAARVLEVAA